MKTRVGSLFIVVLSAACGGSSASGGCEAYVAAYCQKTFRCSASDAQRTYTTEAGCRSAVSAELGCNALSSNPCADGQKLDTGRLEQCVNDTNDQDCVSFAQATPASCEGDLVACR